MREQLPVERTVSRGLNIRTSATSARRVILLILTAFSLVSYVQRMNISIAAKYMMPELSLSDIQMGQIFSSFMLGYALFQVPAGILGDRLGPRFLLTASTCWCGIATLLTGAIPGLVIKDEVAIFTSLIVLRFLLGVGAAATYPVAARAIANWIPVLKRGVSNAIVVAGLSVGAAITPPLISFFMVKFGWRVSFYVSSSFAFLVAIAWRWYATDHPKQNPRVSQKELDLILGAQGQATPNGLDLAGWRRGLRSKAVWLLSVSYFFSGYVLFIFVFWFFLYLVEVRGFSILSGGFFTSLPFVISTVLTPFGGTLSDFFSAKLGRRWGRRIVAISGFGLSAIFLFWGLKADDPYLAIAALSLSVGFEQFTEGAFWSTAIDIAGPYAGAIAGLMNMAGNLGGVVSTALVPILVSQFGWTFALGTGSVLALVAGLIWFGIQSDHEISSQNPKLLHAA
ncbi:MAG TPA: MFS transporter [Pyrinomonadaceae bacterium]|nr:MFS transporter [Pyrinomonadaceae bacterium]